MPHFLHTAASTSAVSCTQRLHCRPAKGGYETAHVRLLGERDSMPRSCSISLGRCAAQKSFAPVMPSCTTIPAIASIARRPLFSSFVCMILSSSGSVGFRPARSAARLWCRLPSAASHAYYIHNASGQRDRLRSDRTAYASKLQALNSRLGDPVEGLTLTERLLSGAQGSRVCSVAGHRADRSRSLRTCGPP